MSCVGRGRGKACGEGREGQRRVARRACFSDNPRVRLRVSTVLFFRNLHHSVLSHYRLVDELFQRCESKRVRGIVTWRWRIQDTRTSGFIPHEFMKWCKLYCAGLQSGVQAPFFWCTTYVATNAFNEHTWKYRGQLLSFLVMLRRLTSVN